MTATPAIEFSSPHYHVQLVQRRGGLLDLTARVLNLTHKDSGRRSTSTLEIELDNADDYILSNADLMRKGAVMRVSYGYPGLMRNAGEFVAKEHAGNSKTIRITGYERKRSRMARKMQRRVWHDTTRSQVVRELLKAHGFTADQVEIEDTTTKYPTISQTSEDDWAFVQRLADLQGFAFYADEAGIHWHRAVKSGQRPTHLMRYVRGVVGVGYIQEYDIDSFGVGVPGRIMLKGRDPLLKTTFTCVASATDTQDLEPLVISDDLQSPDDGDVETRGDYGYEIVRNIGMRSEAEAKKLADALYKQYRYNAVKLKLKTFGDPTLRTHKVIIVWGIGPAVDGMYQIKEVTHTLGEGYSCGVELRRDGLKKMFGLASKRFDQKVQSLLSGLLNVGIDVKVPKPNKATGGSSKPSSTVGKVIDYIFG